MREKRIRSIDVARGIAMISIVLGHLGVTAINRVVYTYHLPIFFLISGYFFHEKEGDAAFLKKKWRQLLAPYLLICLATCVISIPVSVSRGEDWLRELGQYLQASAFGAGDHNRAPFYVRGIGMPWFLLGTFWGEVMLHYLLKRNYVVRAASVFAVFLFCTWSWQYIWLPMSIQTGGCALLYMYIGYLLRKAEPVMKRPLPAEVRLAFGLAALLMWLWMRERFYAFWLVHCEIGHGWADVVGSLCGCYLLMLVSGAIDRRIGILASPLAFLGRYSLLFLAIHALENVFVPYGTLYERAMTLTGLTGDLWLPFVIAARLLLIVSALLLVFWIPPVRRAFGYDAGRVRRGRTRKAAGAVR